MTKINGAIVKSNLIEGQHLESSYRSLQIAPNKVGANSPHFFKLAKEFEPLDDSPKDKIDQFLASKEFTQLDPSLQETIKANLEKVRANPQSVENILAVVKSGGFRNADKTVQTAALHSLMKRPADSIFSAQLKETLGREDFKKLPPDKKLKVIEDLDKYADTVSYTGDKDNVVSNESRKFLLEKIRKTSIFSGQNPSNNVVRNTLDHIVSGKINLKSYEESSKTNGDGSVSTTYGYFKTGTKDIYINRSANDSDYIEFIDTLAHETNHALNDSVKKTHSADLFLSEYRAFIAGQTGAGKKVDKDFLKGVIYNLAKAEPNLDKNKQPTDGYSYVRQLYRQDKKFKELVDQMEKDIDNGTLVDATELRKRLMKAGFNSDYIKNTTNVDNK